MYAHAILNYKLRALEHAPVVGMILWLEARNMAFGRYGNLEECNITMVTNENIE